VLNVSHNTHRAGLRLFTVCRLQADANKELQRIVGASAAFQAMV